MKVWVFSIAQPNMMTDGLDFEQAHQDMAFRQLSYL